MKLLVFAHTPPPHHGQSYMVKLMLDGLGGDWRARESIEEGDAASKIQCYHVNARLSEDFEDIGAFRFEKVLLILRYCLEAIWCRFHYGIDAFYYVPAPGKRAALYRDWIVMLLCRPFFRHLIYHWEAAGLGDWLQAEGSWFERRISHKLLKRPSLGISLAIASMRDALWFRSERVEVVANGIPDPCPDFDTQLLPKRRARLMARRKLFAKLPLEENERIAAGDNCDVYETLFLAHCTHSKGLFDAADGTMEANRLLKARGIPIQIRLTIAGAFLDAGEQQEFEQKLEQSNREGEVLRYAGFVSGEQKMKLLREADCLCFPTYYVAEGQPVSIIEALGVGMSVVTTRWRGLPDTLPPDYPGFVPPHAPKEIAHTLCHIMEGDHAQQLRGHFLRHFVVERYVQGMAEAITALHSSPDTGAFRPVESQV